MEYHKVPGFSVAIIEGGELTWAKGCGMMEVGANEAVTLDTIFQAASISIVLKYLLRRGEIPRLISVSSDD